MNQRPTGVTILAILAFVFGALGIVGALALLGIGSFLVGSGFGGLAFIFGIVALLLGFLELWIGYGFWTLKNSAWRIGMLLFGVNIVLAIVYVVTGYSNFVSAMVQIAIGLGIIYYLTTPAVRAAFGQPTEGGATDAIMGAIGMSGASAASGAPPAAAAAPPAAPPPAAPPPAAPPAASTSSWDAPSTPEGGSAPSAGTEDSDPNA